MRYKDIFIFKKIHPIYPDPNFQIYTLDEVEKQILHETWREIKPEGSLGKHMRAKLNIKNVKFTWETNDHIGLSCYEWVYVSQETILISLKTSEYEKCRLKMPDYDDDDDIPF